MRQQPASLPEFLSVKGDAEVGSYETEVRVHSELKSPGIVSYEWNDSKNHKQPTKDLCALYNAQGKAGLSKFILFDAHTDMDINGKKESSNYHRYHESRYADYVSNHPAARQSMADWLKRAPSVQKKIEQGKY